MEPSLIPNRVSGFLSEEVPVEAYRELLLFELDGELYAVEVAEIAQVMKVPPVTTVPNAPEAIAGVFHLRGKVIVVLDLLRRLRLTRTKSLVPNYLFITQHQKNYFGILVDRTRTVVRVPAHEVTAPDFVVAARVPARYAKGMFMYTESTFPVHKKTSSDFMISSGVGAVPEVAAPSSLIRPVLVLDIEAILNQDDLAGMVLPS